MLAGGVGVTLSLALAVSAGAIPRPGDDDPVRTASVSQIEELAAPIAHQPGDHVAVATPAPTTSAAPAAPTTAAAPKPTAPPTTKAPVVRSTATTKPAATVTAAAPAASPAPAAAKVARRTPSSAEAVAAIAELKSRIGGLAALASISEVQLADAGNQVCTAFDNGQTFDEVKATGLTMIPAYITVTPATVDWAVRKGVAMYCPGHTAKLV